MTSSQDRQRHGGEPTSHHDQNSAIDAAQSVEGPSEPQAESTLPHERGESVCSQASAAAQHQVVGQQALADTLGRASTPTATPARRL